MASSKDKAIALKDNYVDALLKGGVTAPAGGMPEVNMGNQSSVHFNPVSGQIGAINDGDPGSYIYSEDGSTVKGPSDPKFANPIEGKPAGAKGVQQMPPQMQQQMQYEDEMRRGITTGPMASMGAGPRFAMVG